MKDLERLRPVVRTAAAGGDVVEVALALHRHGEPGEVTRTARLLREELELTIPAAMAIAAWADGPGDDEQSRAALRSAVPGPLRPRGGR